MNIITHISKQTGWYNHMASKIKAATEVFASSQQKVEEEKIQMNTFMGDMPLRK